MDDMMEPFGYKTAWLAVRDRSPEQVIAALGLRDGRETSFQDAVEASFYGTPAVLPPLPGVGGNWVLVPGVETTIASAVDLSRELTTGVQLFASERITESHTWAMAENGTLRRALEVEGDRAELLRWEGDLTPVETSFLPAHLDLDDPEARFDVNLAVTESRVMEVARAWSVDPSALDGPAPGQGIVFPPPEPAGAEDGPGFWGRLFGRG